MTQNVGLPSSEKWGAQGRPKSFHGSLPELSHFHALLLSTLTGGPKTGEEIRESVGWVPPRLLDFQVMMRRLHDRRFVEILGVREKKKPGKDKKARWVGENLYQLTEKGQRALGEYRAFAVQTVPAQITKSAKPVAVAARRIRGRDRSERQEWMHKGQLKQICASDAPREFKMLLRLTQPASFRDRDDCLIFDAARHIDYKDARGEKLPDVLEIKSGPQKGREIKITNELLECIRDARQWRERAPVFASQGGLGWCDIPKNYHPCPSNERIARDLQEAVRRAGLGDRGIRPFWLGHDVKPQLEKAILDKASKEFRLFYRALKHSGLDRKELAALRWPNVELPKLRPVKEALLQIEGRDEPVHATGEFLKVLNEAHDDCFGGPLFWTPRRRRWDSSEANYYWERCRRKLHFPSSVKLFGRRGPHGKPKARAAPEQGGATVGTAATGEILTDMPGAAPKSPAMRHPKSVDVAEVCRLLANPNEARKSNNQVVRDFLAGTERNQKLLERKAKSLLRQARHLRHLWEPRPRAES